MAKRIGRQGLSQYRVAYGSTLRVSSSIKFAPRPLTSLGLVYLRPKVLAPVPAVPSAWSGSIDLALRWLKPFGTCSVRHVNMNRVGQPSSPNSEKQTSDYIHMCTTEHLSTTGCFHIRC